MIHFQVAADRPITGIVKSNILLCYPYMNSHSTTIIESLAANTFTSFCLLKISPGLKDSYPEIDQSLRNYFSSSEKEYTNTKRYVLGSLGWNELIVLISSNSLSDTMNDTFSFGKIFASNENSSDNKTAVISKTLSFLGVNYCYIPAKQDIYKGIKHLKYFFQKIPDITKVILNANKSQLHLSISVTLNPSVTTTVKRFFEKNKFRSLDVIGRKDIVFTPKSEISFGDFLAILLYFRSKYSPIETHTTIGFYDNTSFPDDIEEIDSEAQTFIFDYNKLNTIFHAELASNFSSLFFTLNSFFQNPLYGPIFKDMYKYPQHIINTGEQLKDRGKHLHFAQGAREVLKLGAELRTYGTFDTLEEVVGKFSEFRGGAQLSLQALEFFPLYVLDKFRIEWMGFIVTGDPKFFHLNEVINVPPETLWMPEQWWALFHEIAHIIIDNLPEILNRNIAEVQQFLANKSIGESYSWFSTLTEFTAEIIGFELFFFGDFNKFMEVLWKHLVNIDRYQNQYVSVESYALRTFFVQLFVGHFRRSKVVKFVSKEQFSDDLDFLYEGMIKHMDQIEEIVKMNLFENKEFTAANNVKLFQELYNYACHLNKKINEYQLKIDKRSLTSQNTQDVLEKLQKGELWLGDITSPEAILYKLICWPSISFRTRIATILSFWNQQMLNMGKGSSA